MLELKWQCISFVLCTRAIFTFCLAKGSLKLLNGLSYLLRKVSLVKTGKLQWCHWDGSAA